MRESGVTKRWLGWCPLRGTTQHTDGYLSDAWATRDTRNGQSPQPLAGNVAVLPGFTALALAILFITCFVGGEAGWPAVVLGIAIAATIAVAARATGGGV